MSDNSENNFTTEDAPMLYELADQLLKQRKQAAEVEDYKKKINKELKSTEYKLCKLMCDIKQTSFTWGGLRFTLSDTTKYSMIADKKEEIFTALKEHGFEDMITATVDSRKFSTFVREQTENNDWIIPEWLEDFVTPYDWQSCSVTKVKPKK